ncbi:MAG TPA: glycosyltransferase family 2 protein [Bryobacteraceae bacterium]|nr:glycosyltransferase family 2 protein [Bryobacteraceae bacterium]
MKISILIPVYNEFRTFPQVIARVFRAPLPQGFDREIVVVDDGSTDGTSQAIAELARAGRIVAHRSAANLGKGMAIRAGLALASGDIIVIQDGDLEYDPDDYARLVEPILAGHAEVVYGSRFPGARNMALRNRIANAILTAAANLLYRARISDEATAYKAFRAPLLRSLDLQCQRFEFCPEVTAKLRRLGYRIHEVPIRYNARGIADGKKIRARDGFEALWTLIRYRFSPRKIRLLKIPHACAQMNTNLSA